jgi:hypothetical protein
MRTTKEPPWRNLGGRIKLLTVAGKGPQHLDAARRSQRPLPPRGGSPTHRQLHRQRTVMTGLIGKASKSLELLAFDGKCKSGLPTARKIRINPRGECVGAVHTCLPGHGKATRARAGKSTFA